MPLRNLKLIVVYPEVQEWIQGEKHLAHLVNQIQQGSQSDKQAALAAYLQVSALLQLPRTFVDLSEETEEREEEKDTKQYSVFEELAFFQKTALHKKS